MRSEGWQREYASTSHTPYRPENTSMMKAAYTQPASATRQISHGDRDRRAGRLIDRAQ